MDQLVFKGSFNVFSLSLIIRVSFINESSLWDEPLCMKKLFTIPKYILSFHINNKFHHKLISRIYYLCEIREYIFIV